VTPALGPGELARIERFLREQRDELVAGIARHEGAPRPVGDVRPAGGGGRADVGPLAILRGELDQTDRALARLAAGTYGVCVVCGGQVAARRLAILPAAERCDACAMSGERRPAVH
jgi:DnaK suppressor protein